MKESVSKPQFTPIIIDYPNRLTEKKITEEGMKILREYQKTISEFLKEHPVTIVNADGKKIL